MTLFAPARARPVVSVSVPPIVMSPWSGRPFALLRVSALSERPLAGTEIPAPAPVTVSEDVVAATRFVGVPGDRVADREQRAADVELAGVSVSVPVTVRFAVSVTPSGSLITRLKAGVVDAPPIVCPADPLRVSVLVPGDDRPVVRQVAARSRPRCRSSGTSRRRSRRRRS